MSVKDEEPDGDAGPLVFECGHRAPDGTDDRRPTRSPAITAIDLIFECHE
jgi:hypothetical protein